MSDEDATGRIGASTTQIVEREVDGVRVMYAPDESGRTEATLIFGVGARDEELPTLGTLHALEHAVMSTVRRTPIDINASVGAVCTQFTAEGSPPLVAEFLAGICEGLANPPLDRLAQEAKVLEAEDADRSGTSPASVFRYGFQGLGIVDGPGPGPVGVRRDAVRDAASRWFVAANVLLVIEGAWPEKLRLPLLAGARPVHLQVPTRHVTRPSALTVEAPVCELNLVLPAEPATLTRLAIIVVGERLSEVLRHDRGLTYTLDIDQVPIPGGYDVTVRTDPTPGRLPECVRAMVEATRALLADGPSDAELEHAMAIVRESLQGRDAEISTSVETGIDELLGTQVSVIDLDSLTNGREQVSEHLHRVAADVIYVLDEAVTPDLASLGLEEIGPGLTTPGPPPAGEVYRPPLLALALAKEARASRVILLANGLAHVYNAEVQQLPWTDVVGVMRQPGDELVVFGRGGQVITMGPTSYKNGQRLIDAVMAHLPDDLIYDAPPDLADH